MRIKRIIKVLAADNMPIKVVRLWGDHNNGDLFFFL